MNINDVFVTHKLNNTKKMFILYELCLIYIV